MTVHCQVCRQLLQGRDAPPDMLDSEQRRAWEFAALYPTMSAHVHDHHKELLPLIVAMMDQYALSMVANVFGTSDQSAYDQLREQMRAAVWATLNQTWTITPQPERSIVLA